MNHAVKYQVAPFRRSFVAEIYAPIYVPALTDEHRARIDAACIEARTLIAAARDEVAASIASSGVCPYCGELPHPGGACPSA